MTKMKKLLLIVTLLLTLIFCFACGSGKKVATRIVLSTTEATIVENETLKLGYTLFPEDAFAEDIVWKSSNESIANVNQEGLITAIKEGNTTVTVSNSDGLVEVCSVTVTKAKPDFKAIFTKHCQAAWASLSADYSSISIDTNPSDIDKYTNFEALDAIENINKELDLSDALYKSMMNTRALDGQQVRSFELVTVSWSYHPNKGLFVLYQLD